MSRVRNYGQQRAASVASSVTSHTYSTSGGPQSHGEATHRPAYGGGFVANVNFQGKVYSGMGETESEALVSALRLAAELRGMLVSAVMDKWFGDADPLVGRSY